MATKQPAQEPMAVVEGRWLLPTDQAMALLSLIAKAQPVTRDYVSGRGYVYKLSKDTSTDLAISPLTLAQVAALHLETD